jgi:hypothetical protein
VRLEGLGQFKKSSDLPACSIVPQPTTLPPDIRTHALFLPSYLSRQISYNWSSQPELLLGRRYLGFGWIILLRVFGNRVLRRIFGSKRDEVTGGWRELHNEELHNLYSSPSIIRIMKSRRMRWVEHVA